MHYNLLQKLEEYNPTDACEQHARVQMIDFYKRYPDRFERSLSVGHFTASAWLLNKAGTHALLMHHTKYGFWVQLGGHCDGNPNVLEVALKEAQEESGITHIEPVSEELFDITIFLLPDYPNDPSHYHFDVRFLLQVTSDEEPVSNKESKALRWFSADRNQLPSQEQSLIRMFDKWVSPEAQLLNHLGIQKVPGQIERPLV